MVTLQYASLCFCSWMYALSDVNMLLFLFCWLRREEEGGEEGNWFRSFLQERWKLWGVVFRGMLKIFCFVLWVPVIVVFKITYIFNHISQAYYFVTHMNALLHHLSLGSAVGILRYFRIWNDLLGKRIRETH